MTDQTQQPIKKPLAKQWWFWAIVVVILAGVLFIPYIHIIAECAPCPDGAVCVPCPDYYQSLAGYVIDLF